MKTQTNNVERRNLAVRSVAAGIILAAANLPTAQAEVGSPLTQVQEFSISTPLTAYGPGAAPSLNQTLNILQWNGMPSVLQCVTIEVTNRLYYDGTLVSSLVSQSYTLQVRSDFNLVFSTPTVGTLNALDPVLILTGTSPATPNTPFAATIGTTSFDVDSKTVITGAGLTDFVGSGANTVAVTGNLLTTALPGFHNVSSDSTPSPATFVDTLKVFPIQGLQLYKLETTLRVTYFVPEAEISAMGLGGLVLSWLGWRRFQRLKAS